MYNVLVLLVFTACILSCAYGKNLIVNSFYQVVGNFFLQSFFVLSMFGENSPYSDDEYCFSQVMRLHMLLL